jgi:hypothetical protein
MNRIIIWVKDRALVATQIVGSPKAMLLEEVKFEPLDFDFGDVDYLRNDQNRLIGFAYTPGETQKERALAERLTRQSDSLKNRDGSLLILLTEEPFEFDVVQAIGTVIYHDHLDHYIFSIPDWGFGELAFNLVFGENAPLALDY